MANIIITWASYNSTNFILGAGYNITDLDTAFTGYRKVNLFLIRQDNFVSTDIICDQVFQTEESSYSGSIGYNFQTNVKNLPRGIDYKIKLTVSYFDAEENEYIEVPSLAAVSNAINVPLPRPDFFNWSNGHAPIQNGQFNLLASDWRRLQDNINAIRNFKEISSYSFTSRPNSGDQFTATMYNEVFQAINDIQPISTISTVQSGDPIIASSLTALVGILNGI